MKSSQQQYCKSFVHLPGNKLSAKLQISAKMSRTVQEFFVSKISFSKTPKISKDVQNCSRILCFQDQFLSVQFEISVSFELILAFSILLSEPEHIYCQNRLPSSLNFLDFYWKILLASSGITNKRFNLHNLTSVTNL